MSDTKFTPGPWHANEVFGSDGFKTVYAYSIDTHKNKDLDEYAWEQTDGREARRLARTSDDGSATGRANALLLAAAPEMYAALQTMLEAFQVTTPKNEAEAMKNINARRIAREVLSKAEGGAK